MKKGNYIKIMGLLVILFFLFGCQRKQYELQFVRRDDSYVVTGINTFNQEEVVVTIPKKHKGLYVTEIHGLQSEAITEVKFEKGSHKNREQCIVW